MRFFASPFFASNAHQSTMHESESSMTNRKKKSFPPMNGKNMEFITMMIEKTEM